MYNRYIRIPIRDDKSFSFLDSNTPSAVSPYKELHIDIFILKEMCLKTIKSYRYRSTFHVVTGIILIGKDIIAQISNLKEAEIPTSFYQDLSGFKVEEFGVVLHGESLGAIIIPTPSIFERRVSPPVLTDRERLSTAHIQAVTKVVAEQGNQQRGEYADGWMACIRVMCQNLGVEIPENIKIPFQGMHVNDLTAKILEEMKAVAE